MEPEELGSAIAELRSIKSRVDGSYSIELNIGESPEDKNLITNLIKHGTGQLISIGMFAYHSDMECH